MYETVTVPGKVLDELRHADAPMLVREWAQRHPAWLDVRQVSGTMNLIAPRHLDAGGREAIQLAATCPDSLLLIDDSAGRFAAVSLGIPITGTLGILRSASLMNLVDFANRH